MTTREVFGVIVFVLVVAVSMFIISCTTLTKPTVAASPAKAEATPKPVDRFKVECEKVGDFATRHTICSAYDYHTGRTWLYVRTYRGVATLGEVTEVAHVQLR